MKAGQLRRRSAVKAGRSAVEAFSRRGIQPCRGFSCGGGSVVEAGQPQRRSAAEAGGLAVEAVQQQRRFGRRGGSLAVEAVQVDSQTRDVEEETQLKYSYQ